MVRILKAKNIERKKNLIANHIAVVENSVIGSNTKCHCLVIIRISGVLKCYVTSNESISGDGFIIRCTKK